MNGIVWLYVVSCFSRKAMQQGGQSLQFASRGLQRSPACRVLTFMQHAMQYS